MEEVFTPDGCSDDTVSTTMIPAVVSQSGSRVEPADRRKPISNRRASCDQDGGRLFFFLKKSTETRLKMAEQRRGRGGAQAAMNREGKVSDGGDDPSPSPASSIY